MINSLKTFLDALPTGPIAEVSRLETLLMNNWDRFHGSDAEAMRAYKLRGRVEQPMWEPPVLTFAIERHGATVVGSGRAPVHTWSLNLDDMTATIVAEKRRQLYAMDKPLNVKPLAEDLADKIIKGQSDARLTTQADGSVLLNIALIIPETNKQTTAARRNRLRGALDALLAPRGWVPLRANLYSKR